MIRHAAGLSNASIASGGLMRFGIVGPTCHEALFEHLDLSLLLLQNLLFDFDLH